jgi:hypothetical protein
LKKNALHSDQYGTYVLTRKLKRKKGLPGIAARIILKCILKMFGVGESDDLNKLMRWS